MLVFGFGITTDVEHIRYAALDLDQTPESREYLEEFEGSRRYFRAATDLVRPEEAEQRLRANEISLAIEMPPRVRPRSQTRHRARDLGHGRRRQSVSAETIKQYGDGVNAQLHRPPRSVDVVRRPLTARSDRRSSRATVTTRPSRAYTRSCPASRRSS